MRVSIFSTQPTLPRAHTSLFFQARCMDYGSRNNGSCYLISLGYKLMNLKLEVFHKIEQNFNFKKLVNKVECTTFKHLFLF